MFLSSIKSHYNVGSCSSTPATSKSNSKSHISFSQGVNSRHICLYRIAFHTTEFLIPQTLLPFFSHTPSRNLDTETFVESDEERVALKVEAID